MKRTAIYYKDKGPGFKEITKIENAATRLDLAKMLGRDGLDEYLNKGLAYYQQYSPYLKSDGSFDGKGYVVLANRKIINTFTVGDMLTKQDFSVIIRQMKVAGDRMSKILRHATREQKVLI